MNRFNPKPGDIITVENGNRFACCTHEQLNERYRHDENDWDIYGIAIAPDKGWEGWEKDGSNENPAWNIATITPEPTSWAPEPGDTITTHAGVDYICCTAEELTKALGVDVADLGRRDYYGMRKTESGYVFYMGWPLDVDDHNYQIASVTPGPEKLASTLPPESVQAIAEARQIEANKLHTASDTRKFNPKPGDTIVTDNYAYVCCTREYLETHYGNKLSYAFEIYGYRPSFGTGTGAVAMGWDGAGKSGHREPDNDIKAVITVLGNKPKFKGVVPKQLLLDHLATIDHVNVRIHIHNDHSISIE
jgi:hypothetical protein